MDSTALLKTLKHKIGKTKKLSTNKGRLYIRLDEVYANCSYELSDVIKTGNQHKLIIQIGKGERKISSRKDGKKIHGLIDLRAKAIKEHFVNCDITISVYDNCIVIEGTKQSCQKESLVVKMAAGDTFYQESQMAYLTQLETIPYLRNKKEIKKRIANGLTVAGFFCGMGGLDYAFKEAGYDLIFGIDKAFLSSESVLKSHHIETYRHNVGEHIVGADILTHPIEQMPKANVVLAGIPCQELSSVSPKRNQFVMLPQFFDNFIQRIKYMRDTCQVFVIENSNNLLKAGRQFLDKLKEELPWFTVTENNVDAADFGSYQHRKRAIIIGSTIGEIKLKAPKIIPVKNVGMAFECLHDEIPNQLDFSIPGEEVSMRMSMIPPGGNGQDLPEELRTGKYANSYKRLHPDRLSCAIANPRKSCLMPPHADRTLSVRECLRLFDLPDSFICLGSLGAKQQMVANSVPLALGKAIANTILDYYITREA